MTIRPAQLGDCIRIEGVLHQVVSITHPAPYIETLPVAEMLTRYLLVTSDGDDPLALGDALIAAGWTPPSEDS